VLVAADCLLACLLCCAILWWAAAQSQALSSGWQGESAKATRHKGSYATNRGLVQARARSVSEPVGVVCSHMRPVKLTGGVVVVDSQALGAERRGGG
jgi:hypothetical protein